MDYVVDLFYDHNGSWYRKYKSGWIEQGGISVPTATQSNTVTFLKPFSNNTYTLLASRDNGTQGINRPQNIFQITANKTATSFVYSIENVNQRLNWQAVGQGA